MAASSRVALALHAHRRYIRAHGVPRNLDEMARHAIIGFDREMPSMRALGLRLEREIFVFRSVRVAPEAFSVSLDVWVVMYKDLRASHRMRLMFDHLADALAAYVAISREALPKRSRARP